MWVHKRFGPLLLSQSMEHMATLAKAWSGLFVSEKDDIDYTTKSTLGLMEQNTQIRRCDA